MKSLTTLLFIGILNLLMTSCSHTARESDAHDVPPETLRANYQDNKFVNDTPRIDPPLSKKLGIFWSMLTTPKVDTVPDQPIPMQTITRAQLQALPNDQDFLFRLGHSSLLLSLGGDLWLIDPVFSKRASPFQWIGPERFHQPPISIEELPAIKGVIISHNHYDHLDEGSIRALANKTERFYVPLKVGQPMQEWGVAAEKIQEHDWWQETSAGDVTLVATPAQHFSGRGLSDTDETLWASWVIIHGEQRYFFSGDSGYFDGFKTIGERYGPFDLTMMESGAYNEQWADVHMFPHQSVQAHQDVGGRRMLPIHNSTFDLSIHAWYEPMEVIQELAAEQQVSLVTPIIGEPVTLTETQDFSPWWKRLIPTAQAK